MYTIVVGNDTIGEAQLKKLMTLLCIRTHQTTMCSVAFRLSLRLNSAKRNEQMNEVVLEVLLVKRIG